MKLLAFLLMHSVGKPDFLYHAQGYRNHTTSTARKSQCFTDMELRNWNFLDHLFSSGRGVLKCVLINSVTSDSSTYPVYVSIYLFLSCALASQIPPLVSHAETTKIPGPVDDLKT